MNDTYQDLEGYNINMPEWLSPIHEHNFIHPTAIICPNVKMGKGNYVGPFCVIGYPAEHKKYWITNEKASNMLMPTFDGAGVGEVEIGDNNIFTGMVTIDASTEQKTVIMNGCWFLKHSHVGHDAVIGNGVTVSCGAKVGGHCIINDNCNLGLNATIHQWVEIPPQCMIGMGAVVTKKTELSPNRKYAGVPAKDIGENIKK